MRRKKVAQEGGRGGGLCAEQRGKKSLRYFTVYYADGDSPRRKNQDNNVEDSLKHFLPLISVNFHFSTPA
ncbi:hypothetical protein GWI33_001838 [Rhynchophorus ferrugineus]|uniref:Uncharacterized protein n=1 Tax=Rhynchophorus ferrugineus TaxID=354439 RepID=A0A834IL84_RHYFE|nr:hypothetical protein GWI33_001838 [Rhynchophorus ferrugineus]